MATSPGRGGENVLWHQNNPALTLNSTDESSDALVWWRETIKHFSPSWFAVVMGTGVVANILYQIPFHGEWLFWLSVIVFVLNVTFFILAILLSLVRYTIWPKIWTIMFRDPHHSLYLGAIPTGFGTIVNVYILICADRWGPWAIYFGWAIWFLLIIMSMATAVSMPFAWFVDDGGTCVSAYADMGRMVGSKETPLSQVTAVQFIPITATLVSAVAGAFLAERLPNNDHAAGTLLFSWFLWGLGLPLAMIILVMYYHRLTLKHLPSREAITSVFVPLSPIGQGSLAIIKLGEAALVVVPRSGFILEGAGEVVYIVFFLLGFFIWSFGMLWLIFAIGALAYQRKFPFNMGWWSFVFPLGSFTLATLAVGQHLPSFFFDVLGTVFAVLVILIWLVVVIGTIYSAIYGQLLRTSSVSSYEKRQQTHSSSEEQV